MLLVLVLRRHRHRHGGGPVIGDPRRAGAVLRLQRRVRGGRRGAAEGGAAGGVVGNGEEGHPRDEEGEGPAAEECVAPTRLGRLRGQMRIGSGQDHGRMFVD